MRNPLKKIKKKINFRLANNAAQHSQVTKNNHKTTRREDSVSSTSLDPDHEGDPLFNNRSSRLRLALAESKRKDSNSQETTTTPKATPKKKKKGMGRLSFGGGNRKTTKADKDNKDEEEEELKARTAGSKSISPQKASRGSPPKTTGDHNSPSQRSPRSFDAPTKSSQQKCRDKVEPTPALRRSLANNETTAPQLPSTTHHHSNIRKKTCRLGEAGVTTVPPRVPHCPTTTGVGKPPPAKMLDPNLERIAKAAAALDNTGNALFEKGEYDKAMASYVKALKLKNRTLAGTNQQLDRTHNSPPIAAPPTAAPNHDQPPPQPTEDNNDTPPQNQEADDLWISVATSINNIGYLRQQSGQASAEETMQAYQNSLLIKRRVLGKDNLSVGKTLNNLGTVHYLKREYEPALKAYREALQIMRNTLGPHHLDVGTVHSNIGDVYWAQAGEVHRGAQLLHAQQQNWIQQNYQSSRTAALQHYRQSLEIRWEELKDHHDPKVIRLLEKIAALEMGEHFLALVQNSQHRQASPKGGARCSPAHTTAADVDPDEALESESSKPVEEELQTLHEELRSDVKKMDLMERKMAIDMVKDKLRLMREMKKLSSMNYNLYNSDDDDFSIGSGALTPIHVQPLSPIQRTEALQSVKERLQQLRDSRSQEPELMRRFAPEVSDLKEADRSPNNFFLSQRASHLLKRTLHHPPHIADDGLDELRKFSFNLESENHQDGNKEHPKPGFDVSRRATHTLEEGIDALRSLSVNQDNIPKDGGNPWVVASTIMSTSPEKKPTTPSTPLPEGMSAF